ncbi:hypothetical protein HK102_008886, partial [Quaeritorhiza haematococci]
MEVDVGRPSGGDRLDDNYHHRFWETKPQPQPQHPPVDVSNELRTYRQPSPESVSYARPDGNNHKKDVSSSSSSQHSISVPTTASVVASLFTPESMEIVTPEMSILQFLNHDGGFLLDYSAQRPALAQAPPSPGVKNEQVRQEHALNQVIQRTDTVQSSDERTYELTILQHPLRARMTGFGDRDR